MKVISSIKSGNTIYKRIVLTKGVFDGLHIGHQKILSIVKEKALNLDAESAVYTFPFHPLSIIAPEKAPSLLTTVEYKKLLFKRAGFNYIIIPPFTPQVSKWSAVRFLKKIYGILPNLVCIVVGRNWKFGYNASGNIYTLKKFFYKYNVEIIIVPRLRMGNHFISSSLIRKLISSGKIEDANILLGRPYALYGCVVPGEGIASAIGFPTLNIDTGKQLLPPAGVYAAISYFNKGFYNSIVYIGTSPSLLKLKNRMRVEVHIINSNFSPPQEPVEVFLIRKIRDESIFQSMEKLKLQIKKDIKLAINILSAFTPPVNILFPIN